MNTGSVSMNKTIPESGKIEVKSKSSKSEDSFKDMIKSASSKTSSDESNGVAKEPKDFKGTNAGGETEDAETSKDEDVSVSDLASLLVNASGVFDPAQLTKIVNLAAEVQADASALVNEQSSTTQTAIVDSAMQTAANLSGLQTASVINEMPKIQMIERAPLLYAGQSVAEEEGNGTDTVLLSPNSVANLVENASNGAAGLKQDGFLNEQNSQGTLSQENEGVDSTAITTDVQLLASDDVADDVITIKVGEPSLISSWKQVAEEIGNMVVEKINNEVQKVNIKLTPKELGEINVEFLIDNGKISVSLSCSDEGTKALLATNLDSLSKVVQSSLMQDVNVNLNNYDKAQEHNAGSENFDGSGNNGQNQEDSNHKRKEQDQPNLDFAQKLRLGIESLEGAEV
ncbi:MAG: flagellar hook-length control protein FliK [Anaerotignum sp.]|nr:flagellar hook-length control protein FliK [Anaerotignum sp.]